MKDRGPRSTKELRHILPQRGHGPKRQIVDMPDCPEFDLLRRATPAQINAASFDGSATGKRMAPPDDAWARLREMVR